MTPHTIYFVRHGQTLSNVERRLQGRRDTPLTELGRAQARANALTLRETVPNFAALPFVCSPLGRARATMEIVRRQLGLAHDGYNIEERLAEMSFGAWEGMTIKEIKAAYPGEWEVREAQKWVYGTPGGESYAEVAARLTQWCAGLSGDVVAVAHGAVGRILRGLNLGMTGEAIAHSTDPEHDRVYRLSKGSEAAL